MNSKANLQKKKLLVCDNGLFFEAALRLADDFGEVLYFEEWADSYPNMAEAVIGSEWKNGKQLDTFDDKPLRRIENLFDYLDEVDCVFLPDTYYGDLGAYLDEKGMPVCGSLHGEELELERWAMKEWMMQNDMDLPNVERIVGIENLKKYLRENDNKWVKISKFRQHFETFHHINWRLTEPIIQRMEWEMSPMAKIAEFVVEDHIEALIEEGMDAYTLDGKYPSAMLSGCEIKDLSYCGRVVPYDKLSKGIRKINDKLSPLLKEYHYKGFISTEIRTTKDNKNYLIDPCARLGSPPSELYQNMYLNLGEIVWGLANNEIVDPVYKDEYGIEVMIWSDWFLENHQAIYFPPEIRDNVKMRNVLKVDGTYYCLNLSGIPETAALVATGNSFEECKKKLEEMSPLIEGQGIDVKVDAIDKAIEEYNKM